MISKPGVMMQLLVRTPPHGRTIIVDAWPEQDIGALVEAIAFKSGLPLEDMWVAYKGKKLYAGCSVASCRLVAGSTLHASTRAMGGGAGANVAGAGSPLWGGFATPPDGDGKDDSRSRLGWSIW